MSETPAIFTKARVSNITAAVVIFAMIYGFLTTAQLDVVEGSIMGMIAGFAAKHLFDSSQA